MTKHLDCRLIAKKALEKILEDPKKVEEEYGIARDKFLKGKDFDARKKANAITVYCFRDTVLEDYHSDGFISDNEMKNTSIETSARIEYLLLEGRFDSMKPKDIFEFTFKTAYKNNVAKDLTKQMWATLKREADRYITVIQYTKANYPSYYELFLLNTWRHHAHYYDESIKFDGKGLTDNPNKIVVGHQYGEPNPFLSS